MGVTSRYINSNRRTRASEGKRSAAVAQSLRELEKLFGKRPPENDNARVQAGEVGATKSKLRANDNTKLGGAK